MGLLSDEYYEQLRAKPTTVKPSTPQGQAPASSSMKDAALGVAKAVAPGAVAAYKFFKGIPVNDNSALRIKGDLTPEQQTSKFGGEVGSPAYYESKANRSFLSYLPRQLASSVGLQFPDEETWDKMSAPDKAATTYKASQHAVGRMMRDLPKETVKAPIRLGLTIAKPWTDMARGKSGAYSDIVKQEPVKLPWLGEVPNYFQTFDQARQSGMGPLAATLSTGGIALGDATLLGSMAEAVTVAFRPRASLKPGEVVTNTQPIRNAIIEDEAGTRSIKAPEGSQSEYYTLPKTTAKETYGGSPKNTFLKITPAGENSIEVAVVQRRSGPVQRRIDYVKDKMGIPTKRYQGDFGPEVKLDSKIVNIKNTEAQSLTSQKVPVPIDIQEASANVFTELDLSQAGYRYQKPSEVGGGYDVVGVSSTFPDWVPPELRVKKTFNSLTDKVNAGDFNLNAAERRLMDVVKKRVSLYTDRDISMITDDMLRGDFIEVKRAMDHDNVLATIPPKPLRGFEEKPVTSEQLFNLDEISRVNGIDPVIRDTVVRTVTGKGSIAELTQAEYVQAAQTLGLLNNLSKYAPDLPGVNMVSQFASPQRHWMRNYQEKSNVPLYSDVYVPMEEGIRLRNTFRTAQRNQAREIYGKYAGTGFAEERRLISAYQRGEKQAITANEALTPAVKSELIDIATKMDRLYDQIGEVLGVPREVFLKDYQPRVQNIGGVYQMYKEGAEIPKQLEFFAKYKRRGNVSGVQIDDGLALWDIYVNAGSNRLFLNPALERIGKLADTLPENLKGSVRSYTLEKLGYGGRMEEFLDSFVPNLNERMGWNLPADASRQAANYVMSTVYSGLLSSPATWFRQTFQYPLFGYARLGPKFAGDAMKRALTREGIDEVSKRGFLVDLGVPYGEELAQEISTAGKVGTAYKKATQAAIAPNSWADNSMRSIVYHQGKMQFDDALARYNAGKITWEKLETDLDLGSFSVTDRNLIRQRLISGDMDGAFNNYIREILDETNFPYRRGASARMTYGLGGKVGTSLLQWPIEAGHTIARWAKTGQFEKVIRFYAASSAIHRTMRETFGFDFKKGLFLGPFNNVYAPLVRTAIDAIDTFQAFMQNNHEQLNENKGQVVNALTSMGVPAGVELKNMRNFFKSYNAGTNQEGLYPVYNDKEELKYYVDFADLFWGTLMGFPTNKKQDESKLQQDIRNAQVDRTEIKNRVLELMQQEKFDEAVELMQESNITITPQDMDDYYIPLNQRTFNTLPGALKAKFAPRVYPELQ